MECLFLKIICDEPRRPRRGAPAADQVYKHICKHRTAPPCLGEAWRRRSPHRITGFNDFHCSGV